jgi:glycosyltransferase involved in cell wall biosynthesis
MEHGAVRVSVVIPTYKHAHCIGETLDSVFAQTFTGYEIIVVNDGSPDDTAKILAPMAQAGRIRYFEQPNGGQSAARNRGLAESRGKYVAFLDDDDLWELDKLQWQVEALEADPSIVLVYGAMQTFGAAPIYRFPEESAPSGRVKSAFLRYGYIRSPGQTLIRGDVLRRIGGFDPNIWGCDDKDLWLRLADEGNFLYQPRVALNYRNHSANASRDVRRMYANARKVVRKHLGAFPRRATWSDWWAAHRWVRRFNYRDAMRFANDSLSHGDRKAALRYWWIGISINPIGIRGSLSLLRRAWQG